MTKALQLDFDNIVKEEIDNYAQVLDQFNQGTTSEEDWQKRRLWQGIYGQRQPDVQMIRIKIPYGLGSTEQFRKVADLATNHTNSVIHITTRQALQLHFIPRNNTPALITSLAKVGLTSREACGNVVRNVTASPYAAITPDQAFNVYPLAEIVFKHCLRNPYSQNFPRKFKISFSGNNEGDHGLSYIHDIGIIASTKNGKYCVDIYAGGGLGGRPVGADLIVKDMPLEDLLISTTAFMRIFNEFGNRKNRNKARMKFIKLEWGLEKFIAEYNAEFDRIKNSEYGKSILLDYSSLNLDLPKEAADKNKLYELIDDKEWIEQSCFEQNTIDTYGVRVRVNLGDLTSDQMHQICDIADKYGDGSIRSTAHQNLIIPNISLENIKDCYLDLQKISFVDNRHYHISNVIACPGRSTCNLSVTSSKGLAEALIENFDENPAIIENAKEANINISGCHNGCGQHAVATIGFNGSSRMIEGKAVPCAIMNIAGGARNGVRSIGKRLGRVIARKAPQAVNALLEYYNENKQDESFNDFLDTHDIKALKQVIKPFDQVEEGEDIYLDYHMQEGEEYTPAVGAGECAGGVLNLVTEAFDDAVNFIKMAEQVAEKGFLKDVLFNTKEALRHVLRGCLIEVGESFKSFEDCLLNYNKFYANSKLPKLPAIYDEETQAEEFLNNVKLYVNEIVDLYRNKREVFKVEIEDSLDSSGSLSLVGIACPMNYVKAKLALEKLPALSQLEIIIDSGAAFRSVPNSLREDGHKIVQLEPINNNEQYSLIVVKDGLK